jgi:hypothetical protein
MIVCNLIESLEQLRVDLDRMELWAAALGSFARSVPEYESDDQQMLKPWPQPRVRPVRY